MLSIALIVPCYNEEKTIAQVITDFRKQLPKAEIYVCDNNSSDNTAEVARNAGATVLLENRQGKGNAVRRLFSTVKADIYIMVDGDATYDAPSINDMIATAINEGHDMVVGRRIHTCAKAYRPGHQFGNKMITGTINKLFGNKLRLSDILSGYRVMTRRFVETFPLMSSGFDIETELTIHAMEMGVSVTEMDTPYYERPEGSESKLSTYKDGFKILFRIIGLVRSVKPLLLFGVLSLVALTVGGLFGARVIVEFLSTGVVLAIPSAILSMGLVSFSMILMCSGIILDGLARQHRETKLLHYMSASDRAVFMLDQHAKSSVRNV